MSTSTSIGQSLRSTGGWHAHHDRGRMATRGRTIRVRSSGDAVASRDPTRSPESCHPCGFPCSSRASTTPSFPRPAARSCGCSSGSGHSVEFPMDQTCCGQMHYNTGYQREAIPLVRHFVEVFQRRRGGRLAVGVVRRDGPRPVPARGRAGRRPRPGRRGRGAGAAGVRALGVPGPQAGRRGRRRLLSPPGDVSPDLPLAADDSGSATPRCGCSGRSGGSTWSSCPGPRSAAASAGTFAVKNADTSMAMLGDKLRCVLDTRAEVCVAADNSCLMHIGGALHRQRAGVGTIHLAEILAATGSRRGSR